MRKGFAIERKFFTIEKLREQVTIQEKGGGFVIRIDLPLEAAKWLMWKLDGLLAEEIHLGFIGSKSFTEQDMVLTVKANKAGRFLSILCFHRNRYKGRTTIIFPLKSDNGGGRVFLNALRYCLKESTGTFSRTKLLWKPKEGAENHQGVLKKEIQNLNLHSGFQKRAELLRKCAVIVKSNNPYIDCEYASKELHGLLDLKGRFNLMAFSGDCTLAEFFCEEDRNSCLEAKEIYLKEATLAYKRWSPGIGTVSSEHLKIADRWILLKGIPFHLWHSEIFDLICSSFWKFKKIEVVKQSQVKSVH